MAVGDAESGLRKLATAKKILPWASSVYYESAKAHVLLGNATSNRDQYLLAEKDILRALHLVPQQEMYKRLEEELRQVNNQD